MRSKKEIQEWIERLAPMKADTAVALAAWSVLTWVLDGDDAPEYKVGDPDPTPDDALVGVRCLAETSDGFPFLCTWGENHRGKHVAGDGRHIVAVWE